MNFVDPTGALRPIRRSGFLIEKQLKDGVLTVTRKPTGGSGVMPGWGEATARIKFT